MVESRRSLVPFVLLLITASVTMQRRFLFVVTDVDDITLPCENVIRDNSPSCDGTMWVFADSSGKRTEVLVRRGQIDERAKAKRDRLSVTANCSLVVKKVTDEDAGLYACRRFESGQEEDSQVVLSVVNMTEHRSPDEVTLSCSVATPGRCIHAVRWLLQGQRVDGGNTDTSTFQSGCWTNVTVSTSRFRDASKKKESWTCEVTDGFTGEVHLFPFSSAESSGETTDWWVYIVVAVGLAAFMIIIIIIIIIFVRWAKAKQTRLSDTIGLTSNPAATQTSPETRQDVANPEDGVCYTSVSYTKNYNHKARAPGDGDAVTYSTVKPPTSSAGASDDPSNLYAIINTSKEYHSAF